MTRLYKRAGIQPVWIPLDAFKYGVPPHAGLAYGLDRLVMLMAKQDSIRDVIAFPKVKDASCLMTEAPSVVDVKQLNELGLETTAETEKIRIKTYTALTSTALKKYRSKTRYVFVSEVLFYYS